MLADVLNGLLNGKHLLLGVALLAFVNEAVRIEHGDEAQKVGHDHQLIGDRRQCVGPDTAVLLLGLRSVVPEAAHHLVKQAQDLQEAEI